jgi:hypothetical protein
MKLQPSDMWRSIDCYKGTDVSQKNAAFFRVKEYYSSVLKTETVDFF